MILTTPRLILRPWEENDAKRLYNLAKDPKIGPAAGWKPHKSVENSRDIIKNILSSPETYAVALKETNEVIGSVGIKFEGGSLTPLKENEVELGYWLGCDYWGQGFIPEAVEKIIEYCFQSLNCQNIWCAYYDGNEKSKRVQEKCGFIYHHTEENKLCSLLGEIHTEHYTILTKEKWKKSI